MTGDGSADQQPRVETLRDHIREALAEISWGVVYRQSPERHKAFIERHLDAALAILDAADSVFDENGSCVMPRIREIHDPEAPQTPNAGLSEHPVDYDGPCDCNECREASQ